MIEKMNELSNTSANSTESLIVDTSKELELTEKSVNKTVFDYSKELDLSEKQPIYENVIDYSKEMNVSERKDNSYYDRLGHTPKIDSTYGYWAGERGESKFIPYNTQENKYIIDFLKSKGINGIEYKNCYPDFSPIAEETVHISDMTNTRKEKNSDGKINNYGQACEALAKKWNIEEKDGRTNWDWQDIVKWSKGRFSIHESADLKTCQFVDYEVHKFFIHSGGVSEYKKTNRIENYYPEKNNIDKLYDLNEKLKSHLVENGIENAILYGPHNPKEYWNPNNTRIAFCNEEPYSTDGNYEKGIRNIDSDTLDAWSDGNKTIKTEFDLNYLIRHALQTGKEISTEDLAQLKNDIKPNGNEYFNKYDEMDKSLYFNYRYSIPTDTSHEHTGYIQEQYKNDSFYAQHYKEFLETTNPEILVIGSKFGTELYTQIYPELQGKLTYCGEPVFHNGRLVISIPHPSRISNEGITDVVNKIVQNYENTDKNKKIENASSEFNSDKYIEKEVLTLAGVEKGREMTFTEADSGHVNPNLEECEGFQCNCQTCVVVFEARLRGYDIEARPMEEGSNAMQLSEKTNLAWITPEGNHPDYIMNFDANSVDAVYTFIDETVKPGQRYTLEGAWKGLFGMGHIISVFKENTGNLVFYDPQINQIYSKRFMKEEFLPSMQKGNTEDTAIKLLRIDNLEIDTDFIDSIVKRSENYA